MFQFDIGKVKKQEMDEDEEEEEEEGEEQMNIGSMPVVKKEEAAEPEVVIELSRNKMKLKSR